MKYNNKGFSSKELIFVFVAIVILTGISVPTYYYLQKDAALKNVQKMVRRVQKAVLRQKEDQVAFPTNLDDQKIQSLCQNCFDQVLRVGVVDRGWFKVSENEYLYSPLATTKYDEAIKSPHQFRILYNNQTGKLSFVEMQ